MRANYKHFKRAIIKNRQNNDWKLIIFNQQ